MVVDTAQNGPTIENSDTTATLIATTIAPTDAEYPARSKASPPTKAGPAICQRCSPDLSECLPTRTMTTNAAAYGIVERKPICVVPIPDRLRITEGNQNVIP